MKNKFLFLIILWSFTITSQNILNDKDTGLTLSVSEFNIAIQDMFDSGRLDHLYTQEEKNKGVTIIINDFIKPFYKELSLEMFDQSVGFKSHLEILENKNEKFIDILEGSTFIHNNELTIFIGMHYNFRAFQANFKNNNGQWVITEHLQKHKVGTQLPIVNYKMNKEQCLAERIKELKNYNSSYFDLDKCNRFGF